MNETKPKKMDSRNVAIVLGIICIVLLASLFGVILSFQQQIRDNKDAAFRLDRSFLLVDHQTMNYSADSYYTWEFGTPVKYAGYCSVSVQSSTSRTSVWAEWSFRSPAYDDIEYGTRQVSYENLTYVGTSGTVNFPMLPNSAGAIEVGNNDTVLATITVTITYYY